MSTPETVTPTISSRRAETARPWLWNVIVHDSDDHTYEYVVELAACVFSMPTEQGVQLAKVIDSAGHGLAMTAHRELAELKAEQVRSFGPDRRIASCSTSLRVTLEPAEA